MVVGKLACKLNNINMVDGLDLFMGDLSITSPSRKLTAEAAFSAEAGRAAGYGEDDTESFDEEECLFGDTYDGEDEARGGGHYSKASARRSSACLQSISANVDAEEDGVQKRAFCRSSKAAGKRNTVWRGRNPASSPWNLMWQEKEKEKEKENSCDSNNYGHGYGDALPTMIHADFSHGCESFASYDEFSSAADMVPASPSSSSSLHAVPIRRSRRAKKNAGSVRESLLAEAWERKRELMLNEELAMAMANFEDGPRRELLGRSSSDCGKLTAAVDVQPMAELRRSRTRSLTADDFEELQGCIDLGFRFDQSSVSDLGEMLPALEVYCAVVQNLPESPTHGSPVVQSPARCTSPSASASSWKICSPGDDPQDVKGRLKHWAQAVACNARLCY